MQSQDSLEPLIDVPQMHPAESLFGSLQRAASGALDALSRQPSRV
jgi:hypothetical protein